jgi:hypothetical protein
VGAERGVAIVADRTGVVEVVRVVGTVVVGTVVVGGGVWVLVVGVLRSELATCAVLRGLVATLARGGAGSALL